MLPPLRLGIIGTGFITDVIARALGGTPEVVLAGVASRRADKAADFAARHGSVPVHATWEALIASGTVDAVYAARGLAVLADKPFRERGRPLVHPVER